MTKVEGSTNVVIYFIGRNGVKAYLLEGTTNVTIFFIGRSGVRAYFQKVEGSTNVTIFFIGTRGNCFLNRVFDLHIGNSCSMTHVIS